MNVRAPCQGVVLQWVQFPPGKGSLQPVAIEAAGSVTTASKPSMDWIVKRLREQAGRNASERRAGLENFNVGADPSLTRGRPPSPGKGERLILTGGPTGVVATACLHKETGRNTGDPRRWSVRTNRTPARDRPGRLG